MFTRVNPNPIRKSPRIIFLFSTFLFALIPLSQTQASWPDKPLDYLFDGPAMPEPTSSSNEEAQKSSSLEEPQTINTTPLIQSSPPTPKASLYDTTPEGRKIDRVYYLDGTVQSETDLFSDKYNGFYRTFHKNGQLDTELRYQNGWLIYDKAFDEAGRPLFRNGSVTTYYADGHLYEVSEYRNDKKHGTEKIYYYDGTTLVDVWHYFDGRQADIHKRFDANGNFVYSEDWGYPTYYVKNLQSIVVTLTALVVFLLIGLIVKIRQQAKSRLVAKSTVE